jgi:hypothetical protein
LQLPEAPFPKVISNRLLVISPQPYPAGVKDAETKDASPEISSTPPVASSSPTPSSIPPPIIYDDAALLAYASWKEGKSNAGDFETFKTNYLACTIENVKAKSKVMVLNDRAGEKPYPAGVEDAPPAPSPKTTPPIVEASEAVAEASAELDALEETEDMKEVRRLLSSTPKDKDKVVSDAPAPSPTTPMEAVVEASEAMAEASEALAEGFDALEEEEEKLMKEVRRQRRAFPHYQPFRHPFQELSALF